MFRSELRRCAAPVRGCIPSPPEGGDTLQDQRWKLASREHVLGGELTLGDVQLWWRSCSWTRCTATTWTPPRCTASPSTPTCGRTHGGWRHIPPSAPHLDLGGIARRHHAKFTEVGCWKWWLTSQWSEQRQSAPRQGIRSGGMRRLREDRCNGGVRPRRRAVVRNRMPTVTTQSWPAARRGSGRRRRSGLPGAVRSRKLVGPDARKFMTTPRNTASPHSVTADGEGWRPSPRGHPAPSSRRVRSRVRRLVLLR